MSLYRAISNNDITAVYSIVDSNLLNATTEVLYYAVYLGVDSNIVLALLQAGVDPNAICSNYEYDIITMAIKSLDKNIGLIDTLQYLLDYGAVYQYGDYDNAIDLLNDFYEQEGLHVINNMQY